MKSRKHIVVASCTFLIMMGFIASGVSMLFDNETKSEIPEKAVTEVISDAAIPEEAPTPPAEKYVLKIEDGILVVFNKADMTRPIIVTDIYASTLRHYDREQLTEGITATGEFELQCMLEDYSS